MRYKRHFPPEGKLVTVRGRNGARDVVLVVDYPHGDKGQKRTVEVPLEPAFILALAEVINCCPQNVGEVVPVATNPDGSFRYGFNPHVNLGHAVWHLEHPEAVRPCLDGHSVIDVVDIDKSRVLDVGDDAPEEGEP